ncbi:hypothetical protein JOD54_006278 [Actinokineospora baliensis]|uniref:Imm32 family immunity protein n=1 Tax=Actinokineospora baliensis TaxID=547056 RepID=UPI00195745C3|nr:hypothetical protein [Actinokineospora baliensis]MBM7776074.1 hypothetical protein [Actinokineospora baliensis]
MGLKQGGGVRIRGAVREPFLDIAGTRAELEDFGRHLSADGDGLDLDVDYDPAPYDHVVARVELTVTSGPALVSVSPDHRVVHFTGGRAALDDVASAFVDFPADVPVGYTVHVEYYPDHYFLHPDAVPIVIQLS